MLSSSLRPLLRRASRARMSNSVRAMSTSPDADMVMTTSEIPPLTFGSHPFDAVCHLIDYIHTAADVPYFGAIMIGTVVLRTCLIPLNVTIMRNGAKMQLAAPEIQNIRKILDEKKNMSGEEQKAVYMDMAAIYQKHNVSPLRSMLFPFFQMPLFISMFFGIQRMGDYFPGFATGGYGMFENLSVTDPTYILPVANAVSFLLVMESNSELDSAPQGPMIRTVTRTMAVAMPFLTSYFPMVRYHVEIKR